jgi:hypothetical protein
MGTLHSEAQIGEFMKSRMIVHDLVSFDFIQRLHVQRTEFIEVNIISSSFYNDDINPKNAIT